MGIIWGLHDVQGLYGGQYGDVFMICMGIYMGII